MRSCFHGLCLCPYYAAKNHIHAVHPASHAYEDSLSYLQGVSSVFLLFFAAYHLLRASGYEDIGDDPCCGGVPSPPTPYSVALRIEGRANFPLLEARMQPPELALHAFIEQGLHFTAPIDNN